MISQSIFSVCFKSPPKQVGGIKKPVKKACVDQADSYGMTELMYAASLGDVKKVNDLIKAGCNVNMQDKKGSTALMHAVFAGRADVVSILLDNGADPNKQDVHGDTALIYAAFFSKNEEIAQLLVMHGARTDTKNNNNETALQVAKSKGNEPLEKFLEAAQTVKADS
ncbi:MAG: ankyrin repeat domain-containing protein [Candidatus Margulisiibacteriota bacterium]